MKIDLNAVIQAMSLVSPVPALVKAIYDNAVPLFTGADQDTLKAAYDKAWAGAQQDHADFQRDFGS